MRAVVMLFAVAALFPSVGAAQFLEHFTNPKVSVLLQHPPGLGLQINKVAFGPASGRCADQVVDALIDDFVANGIEVVDRQNLTAVLAEHDLTLSGYVDQASAAAIGRILGPSALIFVKSQRCDAQQDRLTGTETRYDPKTKTNYQVRVYSSRTRAFVKFSLQTVDLATGRIFAARVLDYSPERTNQSYEGYPEAPAEYDVMDEAVRMAVTEALRMFLPWSEQTELVFYNDDACGLKEAFQALKVGDIARASDLSRRNLESCQNSPGVKEKVLGHAYYNLGMSHMMAGEHDAALEYFQEAARLRPGDIVAKAIADCQKAKSLVLAMQRIEEKATLEAETREAEAASAASAERASALGNADVVEMAKKKLPDTIIIQKIKTSKCEFDTSPDALVELTKAGVSEGVIMAMIAP